MVDFNQQIKEFLEEINTKSTRKYQVKQMDDDYTLMNEDKVLLFNPVSGWSFVSHVGTILAYIHSERKSK